MAGGEGSAFGGVSGSAFGTARQSRDGACPCGGFPTPRLAYDACCGRFHSGSENAPTAEELMRSRYAAFALGEEAYLLRTWHPRTRPEELRLDPAHAWIGLDILCATGGGTDDAVGTVTYRARSRGRDGREHTMTELSRFERRAGRWVYVDGDVSD